MSKKKNNIFWWIFGLIGFLIILVGGSYAFEFVQIFFSDILSAIGIQTETAQKWTIIILALAILFIFTNRNFRRAINRLFGRN